MTAAEIEAIAGGCHGDAFSVLGPHITDSAKGAKTWEVRAFLPQAKAARVVRSGAEPVVMTRQHTEGFFVASFKLEPGAYQLQLEDFQGGSATLEDPYRFGPIISEFDLHLHAEGNLHETWNTLGAHVAQVGDVSGIRFAVWAPTAAYVSVVGDFNEWDTRRHPMRLRNSGIWEIFLPDARPGHAYKYLVRSKVDGHQQLKSDPFGFGSEVPPRSASVIRAVDTYAWSDGAWLERRAAANPLKSPMSIYELHLGSWKRHEDGTPLSYRELAVDLVSYVKRLGYTHIELLPVVEHPFSGSWGYQVIGYFAPTSRFGDPDDFRYFVNACHQAGIGVIVDWVPAHFPRDAHGLAKFDGTALYEHADPRQGEHTEWGTLIFNFGRNEVRQFLIASAIFWLREYHIDGLRVDAVASMLYLDYAREPGGWIPNRFGGRENLEAIEFLKRFNELAHQVPGAFTIAEESTSFPGVTRPVYAGGLGFTMKWNMGWMHDMFRYFAADPVYRKHLHNHITFSLLYAFTENFVLPISHDEVVYGKRSLLNKMPGDQWQRFANVRAFLGYMFTHPGKKLLFMGCDIADWNEWNHDSSVPWKIEEFADHAGIQRLVQELNRLVTHEKALHEVDFAHAGFEWIDFRDVESSVISFLRRGEKPEDCMVVVCNFTPRMRTSYSVGVPEAGFYEEMLNTDAVEFGGSGNGNLGGVEASTEARHGRPASITITLPPLAVVAFKRRPSATQ
jgi:1,4-alpha-glucan branching enzyme